MQLYRAQDFAGTADMYTFHLEVVAPRLSNERHNEVVQLAKKVILIHRCPVLVNHRCARGHHVEILRRCLCWSQVRDAGMYVGIALRPSTPVEHVFPYCEAGDIDLVSVVL